MPALEKQELSMIVDLRSIYGRLVYIGNQLSNTLSSVNGIGAEGCPESSEPGTMRGWLSHISSELARIEKYATDLQSEVGQLPEQLACSTPPVQVRKSPIGNAKTRR